MKKFQTSTIICMPTDVRNQKKMNSLVFKAKPFTGISGLTAAPAQKAGNISQIASRVRGREAQILSYSYDYLSRLSSSTFHNYSDAGVISGTTRC